MEYPQIDTSLGPDHIKFLKTFTKSCRKSILQMVTNAASGHPGGSLSSVDFLATLYAFIIGQTGEKIVISNGHISPAVYSVLAEMGYVNKEDVINTFRKPGSKFEGHISRHVEGILFGTGPLGVGVSVASAFAHAEKILKTDNKAFCVMGDGEAQEGQVYEMINYSQQYNLNNLILFVDYNKVQLTASLEEVMDIDVRKIFETGHWHVINVDGHDFESIWKGLSEAYAVTDKPVAIIGHTIMGHGVDFMEKVGKELKPDWHGKPPKAEEIEMPLKHLQLTDEEEQLLENFRNTVKWHPQKTILPEPLSKLDINTGTPIKYEISEITDCRSAYGKALLDLGKHNKNIIALSADVKGSVMTKLISAEIPEQYIECGIAEQHMVSAAGGFSLSGLVPFASTFGAFLSSRPKDQARVNDINHCNTKMVATHCGLSVGEDGPTHQAIDDAGTFLGHFNTMVIEPADPNHTDRIIRYIASHYGNFYVRMGRHKFPVITNEQGTIFYDENYEYEYGRCDKIREGTDLTIVAIGTMVGHALEARELIKEKNQNLSIEIIAATSIKKFDQTVIESIKKTKKVITIEDHNTLSGLGGQLARHLTANNIEIEKYKMLGVEDYQLSGKSEELYQLTGLSPEGIADTCINFLTN